MSYSRRWNCEVCGQSQESIDWPDVEVCDKCVGADFIISSSYPGALLQRIANRSYERGFKHGKAVTIRDNTP